MRFGSDDPSPLKPKCFIPKLGLDHGSQGPGQRERMGAFGLASLLDTLGPATGKDHPEVQAYLVTPGSGMGSKRPVK